MVRSIQRYVESDTLRFTYIFAPYEFVVYDAIDGPCSAEQYRVLNGGCGEFYRPGEDPSRTFASDICWPPRPWFHEH